MIKINEHYQRTGNSLLQNIGASVLSNKFNLKVQNYPHIPNIELLGLKYNQSGVINENLIKLYDFMDVGHVEENCITLSKLISQNHIDFGLSIDASFQFDEFVLKFRKEILDHFNLDFSNKNDNLFVHVRLGDVTHLNPGLEYYRTAIKSINYTSGFISTDSFQNPIVQSLITEFNLIPYTEHDPVKVLNFAKDFDKLILSKGSFSWWMAFLSKAKKIIFPKNDTSWYGNIFVYDDWEFIDIKTI